MTNVASQVSTINYSTEDPPKLIESGCQYYLHPTMHTTRLLPLLLRTISRPYHYRHYSSVDSTEASKFILSAKEWWDVGGVQKGLHAMNRVRVPFVKKALLQEGAPLSASQPLTGYSILDVGCGGGILSEPLARLGAHVTGIDVVESNIAIAKEHATSQVPLSHLLSYKCLSVEDLVAHHPDADFDCVVASEVIEHVANVETFTQNLCQLVKPGGSLVVTTINRTYLSYALAIVMAEYVLGLIPRGTHDWSKFITLEELSAFLKNNMFKVVESTGLSYDPIAVKWSFTGNTSVNYCILATGKHTI